MSRTRNPARTTLPKKNGRPTTCTPEKVHAICENLELAMPMSHACQAEGVPWPTMETWIRRGKRAFEALEHGQPTQDDDERYIDAYHAFTRALSIAVRKMHVLALSGEKGCQQATWFLERRYREDYGPPQKVEPASTGEVRIIVEGGLPKAAPAGGAAE